VRAAAVRVVGDERRTEHPFIPEDRARLERLGCGPQHAAKAGLARAYRSAWAQAAGVTAIVPAPARPSGPPIAGVIAILLQARRLPQRGRMWSCPALMGGLGLGELCSEHHVSFRIRWAKDTPGPSGGVRDCRSLRWTVRVGGRPSRSWSAPPGWSVHRHACRRPDRLASPKW
jgi:hypothetical protein